jgi:FKBP-type peptidyl-prolyl cis-trans isomerase
MKSGNKALLAIAAALIVYAVVGLLFMPREGEQNEVQVPQDNVVAEDTLLSYALGVIISQDVPYAMDMLGISESETDEFVKGMRDAFPVDDSPEAVAYARGLLMGASAMETLEEAEYGILQSDSTKKVNKSKFFEAVEDIATGNTSMTIEQAWEYYNNVVYRTPSEAFIERNSTRSGIQVLPSGVQVKVEQQGEGEIPTMKDTVAYIYKGSYINGNMFESSRGETVEAAVGSMMPGLAEVLTTYPVGTKCKVYLPWQRAYGEKGKKPVPPYSALVYDIEIVKIVK